MNHPDLLLLIGTVIAVAIVSFALGWRSPDRSQARLYQRLHRRWPDKFSAYRQGVIDGYQQGVTQGPHLEDDR